MRHCGDRQQAKSKARSAFLLTAKLALAAALAMAMMPWLISSPVNADAATLVPDGDVSGSINLTNSASTQVNNYSYIDESPAVDTDYVQNTQGNTKSDLYTLQDAATSGKGQIASVQVTARAIRTGSGGTITLNVKTNSSTTSQTSQNLTASYASYSSTSWTTNPVSTKEWTWGEIKDLQVQLTLSKGQCTQLYVTITYSVPTLESYQDSSYNQVWGTVTNPYDGTYKTAWMKGSNFTSDTAGSSGHTYHVAYYDGSATYGGRQIFSATATVDATYVLTSDYALDSNSATEGVWHAVVFDDSMSPSPPTYYNDAAGSVGYVVADDFQVAPAAIPEFPAPVAALTVAMACFGIYWWMRQRAMRSHNSAVRIQ